MPGKTTTTIDPEQRDGLYELIRNHLGQIGDIWIALEQDGEYDLAERMGIEFGEDFRLLADLGWEPEDKRKSVELTMEAHDLAELLTRLRDEAEGVLDGTTCMRLQREEEQRAKALYQGAKDTCEELRPPRRREGLTAMATAKLKRLRPGQLDCLVLDYMKGHRKEGPLTATTIAKGLGGRSAGAVANCLSRLAEDGKVRQVERRPRRYVIEGRKSKPTAG